VGHDPQCGFSAGTVMRDERRGIANGVTCTPTSSHDGRSLDDRIPHGGVHASGVELHGGNGTLRSFAERAMQPGRQRLVRP
jgi:hypothetical protein